MNQGLDDEFFYSTKHGSWGNSASVSQKVWKPTRADDLILGLSRVEEMVLPFGLGRSYGDQCLNHGGLVVDSSCLDRIHSFDQESGEIVCESGVTLLQILDLVTPSGWFLPVLPGSASISMGGAVANDIHGKNHHGSGTFGRFVKSIQIVRGNGDVIELVPGDDLFRATIGGMGLTGFILKVKLQLVRRSMWLDCEWHRFGDLDSFYAIDEASQDWEYSVAWVDGTACGAQLGRGIYLRANHCLPQSDSRLLNHSPRRQHLFTIPMFAPEWLLNRVSMSLFNRFYYHRSQQVIRRRSHYHPFFFPLDTIANWNRLYGRRGLVQYQCVIPMTAKGLLLEVMEVVSSSSSGAFLGVLKRFGDLPSVGFLSFPCSGYTLAVDLPYLKGRTEELFRQLDDIVSLAGGRLYMAKDRFMSRQLFRQGYPHYEAFASHMDPSFSSDLAKRIGL